MAAPIPSILPGFSIQKTGVIAFPASREKYTRWDAASPGDDHREIITFQERRGIGGIIEDNVTILLFIVLIQVGSTPFQSIKWEEPAPI